MKRDVLNFKEYNLTVELEVMKSKISRLTIKILSILIITGFCINANANSSNRSVKFKVPARKTIEFYLDVQQSFGDIEIKITDQSHHLNLKIYRPGSNFVYCQSSTWASSIGLNNPLTCSVDQANVKLMEPGKWRIVIEGSVHVNNVDKTPFVTGLLNVSVGNSKPILTGEGINEENESTSSSGDHSTSYGNFKVKGDGKVVYYFNVPPNTKRVDVILKNQSQHVGLEVFGPKFKWCKGTTWTSSVGLDNPIHCWTGSNCEGQNRIEITGQVQKHRLGEFPFVTGQLIIEIDGKEITSSHDRDTGGNSYETPPGHPEVEIPDDTGRDIPTVPEAGGWYPSASMLEYDCNLKGYIKKGDYDMYKFYFPGGKLKAYSKGNLDLVADLLSSDEEQLARDQSSGEGKNFKFEGNYPPGMYYIMIRVMYHGGQGNYELVLGNGKGWSFVEEN